MRRGEFVVVALSDDYGKPRPALIVQSDFFAELPPVVVCPLTTLLREDADLFRIDVAPTAVKGLQEASQIAVDKITVVPQSNIGAVTSVADEALMLRVTRALALFFAVV